MTDLIAAAQTVIVGALAWIAGGAALTTAAAVALAGVIHRRRSR
ncbi:hypothetical protein ACYSUO_18535 [Streptomyces sp. UC4497]